MKPTMIEVWVEGESTFPINNEHPLKGWMTVDGEDYCPVCWDSKVASLKGKHILSLVLRDAVPLIKYCLYRNGMAQCSECGEVIEFTVEVKE